MPRKRSIVKSPERLDDSSLVIDLRRLTKLLALILIKGESQTEKIRALNAAGFAPTEMALLLGTTVNTINVTLHKIRNQRKH